MNPTTVGLATVRERFRRWSWTIWTITYQADFSLRHVVKVRQLILSDGVKFGRILRRISQRELKVWYWKGGFYFLRSSVQAEVSNAKPLTTRLIVSQLMIGQLARNQMSLTTGLICIPR